MASDRTVIVENALAHALAVGCTGNGPYHVSVGAVLNDLRANGWTVIPADEIERLRAVVAYDVIAERDALLVEIERLRAADRQVLDQIRQRHEAAASLRVVEDALAARCQHATNDNADLRSALLEVRIVRDRLDPRRRFQVADRG